MSVNPRWAAHAKVLGREPTGWEFTLWIRDKWAQFARELGCPHMPGETPCVDVVLLLGSKEAHRRFDRWLVGK